MRGLEAVSRLAGQVWADTALGVKERSTNTAA